MFRIFNDHTCKNSSWLFIVFFVDYFFVMQPMIQKYAFSNLMGVGGWWCVCVCAGVRAGWGGDGALAPRRGWCRRSTRHSFLKTRFCLRLC